MKALLIGHFLAHISLDKQFYFLSLAFFDGESGLSF